MQWSPYFGSFSPYTPSAPGFPFPGPYFNRELSASASNIPNGPYNGHSYLNNLLPNSQEGNNNSNGDTSSNNDSNSNNSNSNNNNNDSDDSDDESRRQVDWNRVRQVMAKYLTLTP